MRYGLIGERLGHSFSVEVHSLIGDYKYELLELSRDSLAGFMKAADFEGINVTIPYKRDCMLYLDELSEGAKRVGSVNTIVKRNGILTGYNTDYLGLIDLISHSGVSVKNKKCAVLGTGGTSRAATVALEELSAGEIISVSRSQKDGSIDYAEFYLSHKDTEVIINTTPVGMYPNEDGLSLDISGFNSLSLVLDAIYNPLNTRLVLSARDRGIPAYGGLYMLVAQGVRASEIFLDKTYQKEVKERAFLSILREKENIVLTGMPASGKSTVGRILSAELGRELYDTDELIEKRAGMPIKDIFASYGETHFRDMETEIIRELSQKSGIIISTGGGAVLRRENLIYLRENGRIFFLDRPLDLLIPTDSRPLGNTKEAIAQRYRERYPVYTSSCDVRIDADATPELCAKKIKDEVKI